MNKPLKHERALNGLRFREMLEPSDPVTLCEDLRDYFWNSLPAELYGEGVVVWYFVDAGYA